MLKANKLCFSVPGKQLLCDISFEIEPGELLVILGANGAGKSTLMKILSGELKPSGGQILLHGKPLHSYKPVELSRKRAVLTQANSINLNFKADEIITMGRYPHFEHQPVKADKEIVDQVMMVCGITHLADRFYISLSGGEQQRVQLARVLAQIWDMPEALLLLDEPVTGLDLLYQQKVMAVAKELTGKRFGVIAILHDINLAVSYADRIMMLRSGKKSCDGVAAEVINSENIMDVFGIEADIFIHPNSRNPFILPGKSIVNV